MDVNELETVDSVKQEIVETTVVAEEDPKSKDEDSDNGPELDIVINNVVCSFNVHCHLNLRLIALNGLNVELRRENGMVTMRLRRPYTTASVWSSGRITCTGATSELQAKVAARRFARCLGKLGFPVHFRNFRIFNVLGTCSMPWSIRIVNFSERHRNNASYEPELHPGVTYKMSDPKATLKIFSTGSITVTAANVDTVELAIQRIYPLVYEYRNENTKKDLQKLQLEQQLSSKAGCRLPNTSWRSKPQIYSSSRIVDNTATNSNSNLTNTTASSSDTILANARRRATDCWVSKMQNKRLRYNDANSMSKVTAVARSVAAKKPPLTPKLATLSGSEQATNSAGILNSVRQLKPEHSFQAIEGMSMIDNEADKE